MEPKSDRRALALALVVTVLWSSSWILIRWGLDDHGLRPLGFAGLRYSAAAVVLALGGGSSPSQAGAQGPPGDIGHLVLGSSYTLTQGAQFVAIDSRGPSPASSWR